MRLGTIGFSLEMSKLLALPDQLNKNVQVALDKTGDEAEGIAADLAHVQTGAMRAGLYHATAESSGYEAAVAAARSIHPDVVILPEVPRPPPGVMILADCTLEGTTEELGTALHEPHPFLGPALVRSESSFARNMEDAGRSL